MIGSSFGLEFLKLRGFPGLRDDPIRFIVDSDRLYKLVLREAEFEPKKNSFDVRGDLGRPCDSPRNGCIRIFLTSERFQYESNYMTYLIWFFYHFTNMILVYLFSLKSTLYDPTSNFLTLLVFYLKLRLIKKYA